MNASRAPERDATSLHGRVLGRFRKVLHRSWHRISPYLRVSDLVDAVRTTRVLDARQLRGRGQPHRKWLLGVLIDHIELQCCYIS